MKLVKRVDNKNGKRYYMSAKVARRNLIYWRFTINLRDLIHERLERGFYYYYDYFVSVSK